MTLPVLFLGGALLATSGRFAITRDPLHGRTAARLLAVLLLVATASWGIAWFWPKRVTDCLAEGRSHDFKFLVIGAAEAASLLVIALGAAAVSAAVVLVGALRASTEPSG